MFLKRLRQFFSREIEVYTDGGFKNGRGSWAYVIVQNGEPLREDSGCRRKTSSNEMEFWAVAEALKTVSRPTRMTVHTDSRILLKSMLAENEASAWPKAMGELKALCTGHDVRWKWVKAHSGNRFNERCDELCVQARTIPRDRSRNNNRI